MNLGQTLVLKENLRVLQFRMVDDGGVLVYVNHSSRICIINYFFVAQMPGHNEATA